MSAIRGVGHHTDGDRHVLGFAPTFECFAPTPRFLQTQSSKSRSDATNPRFRVCIRMQKDHMRTLEDPMSRVRTVTKTRCLFSVCTLLLFPLPTFHFPPHPLSLSHALSLSMSLSPPSLPSPPFVSVCLCLSVSLCLYVCLSLSLKI